MNLEHLDEFLEAKNNLVKNTLSSYKTDLKQFSMFYKKDISELDSEDIESYITYLLGKGFKAKTINRKLTSLRRYVEYLNGSNKLENKVALYIEGIKVQEDYYIDPDKIININEFNRIAAQAKKANDKRAIAIIYTLGYTGVRVSELLQLHTFQYKTGEVTVRGKGRKFRNVPIAEELIYHIDEYVKERRHKAGEPIFMNERNNKVMSRQEINKIIKRYAGQARIKKTKVYPHAFRHLFCLTLSKDMPLDEVAALVGHSNINTTRIYTKRTKEELKRSLKNSLKAFN
ncbi:tyrosine-type recombinase/integrase [Wukongibacter sp. M2B1]|uniref:tyrosine-type recombinase/integrase n=1 Tax=Wukongibacter sp. M2B1 TaxID=3088895 RepID=UPI003D7BFC50